MKKSTYILLASFLAFLAITPLEASTKVGLVNTNLDAVVNTTTSTSSSSVDIDTQVNINSTGGTSSQSTTSSIVTTTEDSEGFVMTRGDLSGEISAQNTNHQAVTSSSDLNVYAKSVMVQDENISKIDVSDKKVVVSYKVPAKFLWFIPSKVTARAVINADGTSEIKYPWYTFLSSKNDAEAKAQLETQAKVIGGSTTEGEFSSRRAAEVIHAAIVALKAQANTNTEVKSNTNTNVSY